MEEIEDEDSLTKELYALGLDLGFSLGHIRGAIEAAPNKRALRRKWIAFSKEEVVFLSAGWPDYTTDPFRAMPDELPPMPETTDELKARREWLLLALRSPDTT